MHLMMNWNFNTITNHWKQDQIAKMLEDFILQKEVYFELDEIYNNNKKLYSVWT